MMNPKYENFPSRKSYLNRYMESLGFLVVSIVLERSGLLSWSAAVFCLGAQRSSVFKSRV